MVEAFLEALDRDIILFIILRIHAGVEGVVQFLVLRHRFLLRLQLLLVVGLLLRSHPSLGFFAGSLGAAGLGSRGRQIEVHRNRISQVRLYIINEVNFLAADLNRDAVGADREPTVVVMTLLIGLDLIAPFDVGALEFDLSVFDTFPVFSLYIALECSRLGPGNSRE